MPSASPRMIRLFCQVLPGPAGDLPLAYFRAFAATDRRLRAQPIGMAQFTCERRWWDVSPLFEGDVDHQFVNVVVASLGLRIALPPLPPAIARTLGDLPPPKTALQDYYTAGLVNVAVVVQFAAATTDEIVSLHRYDRIVVPLEEARLALVKHGLAPERVICLEPDPGKLAALLFDLGA